MKTKFVMAISILVVLAVIAMPTHAVSATPSYATLNGGKECKDPKAPCTSETFSSAIVNKLEVTTNSVISTVTYTCGINIKNSAGTKIATLSETATVQWRTDGFTITAGSRSTWVKWPSITYWYEITGPSGIGASAGTLGIRSVTTSARLIYTAVYDGTAQVRLSFSYDRQWGCSSSYAK